MAVFPTETGMRASPGLALTSAAEPESLPLATLGEVCTLLSQPWPVGDFLTPALQGLLLPPRVLAGHSTGYAPWKGVAVHLKGQAGTQVPVQYGPC